MTVFPHHLFLQDNKRQGGRKEREKGRRGGTGIVSQADWVATPTIGGRQKCSTLTPGTCVSYTPYFVSILFSLSFCPAGKKNKKKK